MASYENCGNPQHHNGCTCDRRYRHGNSKLSIAMDALDAALAQVDALKAELSERSAELSKANARYVAALEAIAAFGVPLEKPKAYEALRRIGNIAVDALHPKGV